MGWAATPQEVFDNTLINYRVGEDQRIMLPQFVCQDGYFLSHISDKVILPELSQVREFLPPYKALILSAVNFRCRTVRRSDLTRVLRWMRRGQ